VIDRLEGGTVISGGGYHGDYLTAVGAGALAFKPGDRAHAELVAQLPVPDGNGGTHHTMPDLQTNEDYRAYIRERSEAWLASRRPA
jgi:hypothetical protein